MPNSKNYKAAKVEQRHRDAAAAYTWEDESFVRDVIARGLADSESRTVERLTAWIATMPHRRARRDWTDARADEVADWYVDRLRSGKWESGDGL